MRARIKGDGVAETVDHAVVGVEVDGVADGCNPGRWVCFCGGATIGSDDVLAVHPPTCACIGYDVERAALSVFAGEADRKFF